MLNERERKLIEQVLGELGVSRMELYRRCAEWCMAQRDGLEALRFYFLAGADERLLTIFEGEGGSEYYDRAPEIMEGLFQRCTMDQKLEHPTAYLNYLQNRVLHDRTCQAMLLLESFQHSWEAAMGLVPWMEAELRLIRSFLQFNDASKMARCHREAARLLDGRHSRVCNRDMVFTFGAGQLLVLYHRTAGHLKDLTVEMEALTECFVQVSGGCGAGGAKLLQAELALEAGNWDLCRTGIRIAAAQAAWSGQVSIQLAAHFLQARLALAEGDQPAFEAARRCMASVERKNPLEDAQLELSQAYLSATADEDRAYPVWIEGCDPEGGYLLPFAWGWRDMVIGKVLLQRRRYLELESLREAMLLRCRDPDGCEQIYVRLYALLFGALACTHLGGLSGYALAEEAVALAAPDHITTPFLELAEEVLPLLCHRMKKGYGAELAQLCRRRVQLDRTRRAAQRTQRPTPREMAVLELMACGCKRPDIAQELGITQNTVRKHLDNLYHKLGVHDRSQAIAWLRRERGI